MSNEQIHVRAVNGSITVTIGETSVTLTPQEACLLANDILATVQAVDNRAYLTWLMVTIREAGAIVEERLRLEQLPKDSQKH